jgi:hypothetical protein
MTKTIEIYEKTETKELQILLKQYETYLENGNVLLKLFEKKKKNLIGNDFKKLKTTMNDYEIDEHLIRMELNKRLWEEGE